MVVEEAEVREQQTNSHIERTRSVLVKLPPQRAQLLGRRLARDGRARRAGGVIGHGRLPSAAATILAGLLFTGLNVGGRVGALGFGGESAAAALETRATAWRRRRRAARR